MSDVLHAIVCPVQSHWRLFRYWQPFWVHDPVARTLGVNHSGCPRCGRGFRR